MSFRGKSKYNEFSVSYNSEVPPWCSSGRVYKRSKPRKIMPTHCGISFHPLRENIWDYSNNDNDGNLEMVKIKQRKNSNKQTLIKRSKCRNVKSLTIFLLSLGFMSQYLQLNMIPKNLSVHQILPKANNNYIAYLGMDSTAVNEECCHRMKHLALALNRAEQALRALRHRKSILSFKNLNEEFVPLETETGHIEGTQAIIGENTTEWGGNVALWGILPLWRAAPPPDTVLKHRRPTPSDCWPFRGSYGEIIIEMPKTLLVSKISVEHIRPDTARSAPKNFVIFGVLSNGTWIKGADGIYEYNKPAKQYFKLDNRNVPFQQIVFRVLSNQGNITTDRAVRMENKPFAQKGSKKTKDCYEIQYNMYHPFA